MYALTHCQYLKFSGCVQVRIINVDGMGFSCGGTNSTVGSCNRRNESSSQLVDKSLY